MLRYLKIKINKGSDGAWADMLRNIVVRSKNGEQNSIKRLAKIYIYFLWLGPTFVALGMGFFGLAGFGLLSGIDPMPDKYESPKLFIYISCAFYWAFMLLYTLSCLFKRYVFIILLFRVMLLFFLLYAPLLMPFIYVLTLGLAMPPALLYSILFHVSWVFLLISIYSYFLKSDVALFEYYLVTKEQDGTWSFEWIPQEVGAREKIIPRVFDFMKPLFVFFMPVLIILSIIAPFGVRILHFIVGDWGIEADEKALIILSNILAFIFDFGIARAIVALVITYIQYVNLLQRLGWDMKKLKKYFAKRKYLRQDREIPPEFRKYL